MAEAAIRSTDIRCALRLRYPESSHALLWEVADATGANQRRFADAVAIGLWPSHGHEIEGVEIKVSRGDWLRECAQPEKSQAIFQYCNRWWLAVPKGLVAPDELPPTWGLLELVNNSLRTKKKAPALKPSAPTVGFVASLLRRHAGADAEMTEALLSKERRELDNLLRAEMERTVQNRLSSKQRELESIEAKLASIREATGIDFARCCTPAEEWVAAIRFLTEHSYRDILSRDCLDDLRRDLARVIAKIDAFPTLRQPELANG